MSIIYPQDGQWRRLFVYCNFLVLPSTTVCSQNINKQNVNIADETLTDYSFLGRYHYTKSKNYLKRRYRIRQWIPMFIGTPCTKPVSPFKVFHISQFQFCNRSIMRTNISLENSNVVNFWYFNLRLFDLAKFIVWNIKGLQHRVAMIQKLEFVSKTHFL